MPTTNTATVAEVTDRTPRVAALRDWIADFFSDDKRAARQATIRQTLRRDDVRELLAGLFAEARDSGADLDELREDLRESVVDIVARFIGEAVDARVDLKQIGDGELWQWLEEHDGPFIERQVKRLLTLLMFRRQQQFVQIGAARFTPLLPGPLAKVRQPRQPRPGAVEVVSTDTTRRVVVPGTSAAAAARRVKSTRRASPRDGSTDPADAPTRIADNPTLTPAADGGEQ